MPSPSPSSCLSSDIRALTSALALVSSQTSQTSTKPNGQSPDKIYHHIITLLTRDGVDDAQADITLAGVAMYRHFSLFAVHQSPPSSPETTRASSPYEDRRSSKMTAGLESAAHRLAFPSTECNKIRFESFKHPQPSLTTGEILDAVLETGLKVADLNQHVSDVKQILLGFSGYDLSEDDLEERQTRCLIFFQQRSLEKLTQRFHNPRFFFTTQYTPWWRMLTQWNPDPEDFPVREFNTKYHLRVIFNALSPGLISYTGPTVLDCETAVKCVTGLAVLLDVIDGKLLACKQPSCSDEDWERLNTTLRMLYSLLYETEVIRHIFINSSCSAYLLSMSRSTQCGSDEAEKHDGAFLFRKLQTIVAWQRALLVLASTKVVRAAIPIHFNLITIPPPPVEMTSIMDLVNEIYTSKRLRTLIRSHLTDRGVLSHNPKAISSHYNASLMGILMATDSHKYRDVFAEDLATDPRKIQEMKDGILQVISTVAGKKCCYACDKLVSLFTVDLTDPPDGVFRPWSPPLGIRQEVLRLLRDDLMHQFKHHLDCVVLQDKIASTRHTTEKENFDQLSFLRIVETIHEYFPDGL